MKYNFPQFPGLAGKYINPEDFYIRQVQDFIKEKHGIIEVWITIGDVIYSFDIEFNYDIIWDDDDIQNKVNDYFKQYETV